MNRYAALLRGISPSGRNQSNDQLRGVFERLGFQKVGSVLASGNLVFTSPETELPALEQAIERALTADLGLASQVNVRSQPELAALLASDPFAGLSHGRGSYLTATFLKDVPATPPSATHLGGLTEVVGYHARSRAILAVTDNSEPGRTPDFMIWLEKNYGKGITTRTWLTVGRIVKKLESL
ncbi:MAG: DUF1697 domain-containing protein [Propionicimonas sp.]|uniref:DUF1697 domain-containing protein n=1 Tax=Propionicimonas sp. TaxID=1955623 RepID=UPI002B21BDEF|nr:DUF1697 domain-containing protein [Propionicimonas sp.]MEA4944788.1 DUF1697 domain-containing protein [Propionicimonas sp.]MEA5052432.1 DUF1697 domain-containing protein [Propionicimonas sp.]MEA5117155.1 DUF1697 domain-containing protein [Propionicimonas sp.]